MQKNSAVKIFNDERQGEIVPEALRHRFGWDERHDAAATQRSCCLASTKDG